MYAQFCCVKVKDRIAVAKFLAKGVVPAHGVDLLPRVFCHIRHLMEHLPPAQRQVAPGNIQAGHQQVAAGGRLRQVDDLPHIAGVDVGSDQQQAGLRQAAAAFVHGHRRHIRARCHGGHRQPAAEIKVGAVGFIGKAEHPRVVRHTHNGAQVAADAVVGGVVDQHRHGVRMLGDRLGDLLALHTQADAQPGVHLGVDVHRHGAAQHQGVQHAAVDVARQNDLVPALAGGQHHALHRAGRAADHQKGVRRAKGIGCQFLRLPDDRHRVAKVIQRFHTVDVHAHALLPQKSRQFGVAPPALMPGYVKGYHAHLAERFQRLVYGGAALIQTAASGSCVHSFDLPAGAFTQTKNASLAQIVQTCVALPILRQDTAPPVFAGSCCLRDSKRLIVSESI